MILTEANRKIQEIDNESKKEIVRERERGEDIATNQNVIESQISQYVQLLCIRWDVEDLVGNQVNTILCTLE